MNNSHDQSRRLLPRLRALRRHLPAKRALHPRRARRRIYAYTHIPDIAA